MGGQGSRVEQRGEGDSDRKRKKMGEGGMRRDGSAKGVKKMGWGRWDGVERGKGRDGRGWNEKG